MFFLTRAGICIGLVAIAASNAGGPALTSAVDQSLRGAASSAGQACLRSADCLRMGAGLLAAASPLAGGARQDGPEETRAPRAAIDVVVPLPPPRPVIDGSSSRRT
jgi:hypothetical protein